MRPLLTLLVACLLALPALADGQARARAALALASVSTTTPVPTPSPKAEPCCSSACTCGCNEGLPCRCGNSIANELSQPSQHHAPMLRASMFQPVYVQPLQSIPHPTTMSAFRFAPTYSAPFFQGSGRSCGSGG